MNKKAGVESAEIFKTLSVFSKSDLKNLSKFLNSPFFEIKPFALKLYEVIIKELPLKEGKVIEGADIFLKSFGKKKYNEAVLRKGFSLLTNYIYEYLAYVHLKHNKGAFYSLKIKGIYSSPFKSHLKKFEKNYRKEIMSYGFNRETNLYLYEITSVFKSYVIETINPRSSDELTIEAIDEFALHFIFNTIFHSIEIRTVKEFHNRDNSNTLSEALLKNFNVEGLIDELENIPMKNEFVKNLIAMYAKGNFKNDKESLTASLDLIFKERDKIDLMVFHSLFFLAAAYKSYKIIPDHKELSAFRAKYYKMFLSGKTIFDTGVHEMPFKDFLEYINLSFHINDIEWAEQIAEKYIPRINAAHRKDAENFFKGKKCFFQCNYTEALPHLNKISNNTENIINLQARNTRLQCLYKLGYDEEALSMAAGYKSYISSTKIFPQHYNKSVNIFLGYYKTLVLNRETFTKSDWEYTLSKLAKEGNVYLKLWLQEEIENLINKKSH